ncbi:DUF2283 domain-containing protein [Thermodesulfovibrio sp. TK110]
MDKNKVKVRYDREGDILYISSGEGSIKDTVEIGEDVFIEIGETDEIIGIEIWQARRNIFNELFKYLEELKQKVSAQ